MQGSSAAGNGRGTPPPDQSKVIDPLKASHEKDEVTDLEKKMGQMGVGKTGGMRPVLLVEPLEEDSVVSAAVVAASSSTSTSTSLSLRQPSPASNQGAAVEASMSFSEPFDPIVALEVLLNDLLGMDASNHWDTELTVKMMIHKGTFRDTWKALEILLADNVVSSAYGEVMNSLTLLEKSLKDLGHLPPNNPVPSATVFVKLYDGVSQEKQAIVDVLIPLMEAATSVLR